MRWDAISHCIAEGEILVVGGFVDLVDQRRPLIGADGVHPVAQGAVGVEHLLAGPGGVGQNGDGYVSLGIIPGGVVILQRVRSGTAGQNEEYKDSGEKLGRMPVSRRPVLYLPAAVPLAYGDGL